PTRTTAASCWALSSVRCGRCTWSGKPIRSEQFVCPIASPKRFVRPEGPPPTSDRSSTRADRRLDHRSDSMIEVKCIGGECHGLSVKIEPQPTYYEVVDPRDRTRRDFYILEVGPQGARLVPEETAEWRGRI